MSPTDEVFSRFPVPMYVFDAKSLRLLDANDAALEAYGYDREEFLKLKLTDIRPRQEILRLKERLSNLTETPTNFGIWRHAKRDGSLIDVEIICYLAHRFGREAGIVMAHDVTDREQALRALEEHEALLAEAQDMARMGTFTVDLAKRESHWSPELYRMFGLEAHSGPVSTKEFLASIHPEDRGRLKEAWGSRTTNVKGWSHRYRICHKELGVRHIWSRAMPHINDGRPARLLGIAQDVTEIVDKERSLHATEKQYESLLKAAAEGVATVDVKGNILFVNDRLCEMFGYSEQELLGKQVEVLVPRGARTLHKRERMAFYEKPERRMMGVGREIRGLRKNGEEFPIEASLTPVETDEGRMTLALVTDVSRRVEAENELRRHVERLKVLHDVDRTILQSRPFEETTAEALKEMRRLIHCDRADVVAVDQESGGVWLIAVDGVGRNRIRPGTDYSGERVVGDLSRLTSERWIRDLRRLKQTPVLKAMARLGLRSYLVIPMQADGELIGAMILWYKDAGGHSAAEIEAAKQVAAQLAIAMRQGTLLERIARHAEELERLVAQRTAELKARNQDLQAFAYSVSHDLRAPLRAMRGFGEALLEDFGTELDEMGRDFIQRIVAAAGQMDELIQDLLAYSRIAHEELVIEPVPLMGVMRDVLRQVGAMVEEYGGKLTTRGMSASVRANRRLLVQALSNLISNAAKFCREGVSPEIHVQARAKNGVCRIEVRDNGIGISKKHQERIFGIFERLHPSDRFPGTGIGLAIVQRGMERLGGTCGVESREGRGSTFWLELPAA